MSLTPRAASALPCPFVVFLLGAGIVGASLTHSQTGRYVHAVILHHPSHHRSYQPSAKGCHSNPTLLPMEDYQDVLSTRHSDSTTSTLLPDWPLLLLLVCHSHVLPHLNASRMCHSLTNSINLCHTFLERSANRRDVYAPSCSFTKSVHHHIFDCGSTRGAHRFWLAKGTLS